MMSFGLTNIFALVGVKDSILAPVRLRDQTKLRVSKELGGIGFIDSLHAAYVRQLLWS